MQKGKIAPASPRPPGMGAGGILSPILFISDPEWAGLPRLFGLVLQGGEAGGGQQPPGAISLLPALPWGP